MGVCCKNSKFNFVVKKWCLMLVHSIKALWYTNIICIFKRFNQGKETILRNIQEIPPLPLSSIEIIYALFSD